MGPSDAQILRITGAVLGSVGVIIVAAGAQNVKLGVIDTTSLLALRDCDDLCGGTVFDGAGNSGLPWTLIVAGLAPEPCPGFLLGLGLCGMALIRRLGA